MTLFSRRQHVRVLTALTVPVLLACAAPASAQQKAPVGPSVAPSSIATVPSQAVQIMLVQSALSAFNQANLADDYSVLLKNASTGFRQVNSQAQLSAAFLAFRTNRIDLSPAVLFLPRWTQNATLEGGALHLVGTIPSRPSQVGFDLRFVPEEGRWRLAALSIQIVATEGSKSPNAGER